MNLKPLQFGNCHSDIPILQAGMGVRVATGKLAGTVMKEGGMGIIASVGLGEYYHPDGISYKEESIRQLRREIQEARSISGGRGSLGVNIMVALTNYEDLAQVASDEGVDFIVSGAGIPMKLPQYVSERTALVPVLSNIRVLKLLISRWKKQYSRIPDAVILEGPRCGGHLGFSEAELKDEENCSIEKLLFDAKEYLTSQNLTIPLIAAEGTNGPDEVRKYCEMGFSGVQVGTRFICTRESGMSEEGKQLYLNATEQDITVITSPVGLPVRVLRTPLVERVEAQKRELFRCSYHCLATCNPHVVPFCIGRALLAAKAGDIENGLFMTGMNIEGVNSIPSVAEFMQDFV